MVLLFYDGNQQKNVTGGQSTARQERGLKHRADRETRAIPIPPGPVRLHTWKPPGYVRSNGMLGHSAHSGSWAGDRCGL